MQPEFLLARSCGSAGVILFFILASFVIRLIIRQHKKQQEQQRWMDYDLSERQGRLRSGNPVVQTTGRPSQAVRPSNPHSLLAGMRVLVADDSKTIRKAVTSLLEPEGVTVRRTGSGQGAWQTMRHERLDLIIVEERLPDMSAYDLLDRMRADAGVPDLPVVLLHSQEMLAEPLKADQQASAILRKPFSSQDLLSALHRARTSLVPDDEPPEGAAQAEQAFFEAVGAPTCPVCEHPVEDQLKRCPACEASHHPECWILNDGCGNCGEES